MDTQLLRLLTNQNALTDAIYPGVDNTAMTADLLTSISKLVANVDVGRLNNNVISIKMLGEKIRS